MENSIRSIKKDGNTILEYDKIKGVFVRLMTSKSSLSNNNERIRFIKKCESNIRKSKRYKKYKLRLLKKGINMCAIFGNITDDKAELEMHHGPIFTLWDYIEITINYFYLNNIPINTFSIANQVLKDHFDDLIQVVMVSETIHKMIHNSNSKLKISIESAWGDIVSYLNKYKGCISPIHFSKINNYFDIPLNNRDLDIIKYKITKWNDIEIPDKLPTIEEIRKIKNDKIKGEVK